MAGGCLTPQPIKLSLKCLPPNVSLEVGQGKGLAKGRVWVRLRREEDGHTLGRGRGGEGLLEHGWGEGVRISVSALVCVIKPGSTSPSQTKTGHKFLGGWGEERPPTNIPEVSLPPRGTTATALPPSSGTIAALPPPISSSASPPARGNTGAAAA